MSQIRAAQTSARDERQSARSNQIEHWLDAHSNLAALVVTGIGFIGRLKAASGTFLNPDEALHFFIANRTSWALAYKASLTMAHPPLLIFVLYWWRHVGTSEFMLRLPSAIAGTAFCWMFFLWLKEIFRCNVALIGLMFAALLPPVVALSAEVRQYEFMLFFAVTAAYLLERAFREDSASWMLLSSGSLYLAMLSHYSAFMFAATLGLYAGLRISRHRASARVVMSWVVGQLGALGLAIFLYITHISKVKGTMMAAQAFEVWLYKSYFHPGQGNALSFAATRTFSVFQYLMGQLVIGDIAALLFIAGVLLMRSNILSQREGIDLLQVRCLILLPFILNCGAALAGVYPYGGTRHCAFLIVFAVVGLSLGLVKLPGARAVYGIGLAVLLILLCYIFRTVRRDDMTRADQSRTQMESAASFVREQIPASEPILVDYESGLELGHYLCDQQPVSYDNSTSVLYFFHCGTHQIISTVPDVWPLNSLTLAAANEFVHRAGFRQGQTVWIAQVGWVVDATEESRENYPGFRRVERKTFGRAIVFFRVEVN